MAALWTLRLNPLAQVGGAIGWSIVLIGLLVAAFFLIVRLRQWLKTDDEPVATGFSLSSLRELHRQGKMSDEEFEKAKSLIVTGAKKMAASPPDPLARPDGAPRPRRRDPQDPRGPAV